MIPIQILRVLSTIQQYDVPALLIGGQSCVLYGAAEYSRHLDLAVLGNDKGLPQFSEAMQALDATVIAVPPFESQYLSRGHAVHFNVPGDTDATAATPLRVDIMSRMRGVAPFEELWARRTTITLPDAARTAEVTVELMALEDLVTAKKTQCDKAWPMLRRLVDASYDSDRDSEASAAQAQFWLSEVRSPEFLREAVERFPRDASQSTRNVVAVTVAGGDVADALAKEQSAEMAADRVYWEPLCRELELLRYAARRG